MFYDGEMQCFSYACSNLSPDLIDQVKYTNKLCLPPEVLYEINETDIIPTDTRLYFKVSKSNTCQGQVCGVHEFSAPPGIAYIPYHIMEQLKLSEGETIRVFQVKPRKGTFMKLQFHTTEFANLLDPKEILEHILSQDYPIVTKNHTLALQCKLNDKIYYVNILETKPSAVIEIINTDINVDFAEPVDPSHIQAYEPRPESRRTTPIINNIAPILPPVNLDYSSSDDECDSVAFLGQGNTLGTH
jgi:ubiquitin fusion degradation protein 1